MTKSHKIAFRILFFLYIAIVLVLCFGRFDNAPAVPWSILGIPTDKLAHFVLFFPFPILAFLAFDQYTETPRQTLLFAGTTLVVGILVAMGTEWGQDLFTEYRRGEFGDFLADFIALILSTLVVIYWDIRKQRKKA